MDHITEKYRLLVAFILLVTLEDILHISFTDKKSISFNTPHYAQ